MPPTSDELEEVAEGRAREARERSPGETPRARRKNADAWGRTGSAFSSAAEALLAEAEADPPPDWCKLGELRWRAARAWRREADLHPQPAATNSAHRRANDAARKAGEHFMACASLAMEEGEYAEALVAYGRADTAFLDAWGGENAVVRYYRDQRPQSPVADGQRERAEERARQAESSADEARAGEAAARRQLIESLEGE